MKAHRIHLFYIGIIFLVMVTMTNYKFENKNASGRFPASVEKIIIGNSEHITYGQEGLIFDAKVDSGAETSSMHAYDVHELSGKRVQFKTIDRDGREIALIKNYHRKAKVKNAMGNEQRFFIKDTITLGSNEHEIEISLADRTSLSKKFLLGKNLLDISYQVDTSRIYLNSNKSVGPTPGNYLTLQR